MQELEELEEEEEEEVDPSQPNAELRHRKGFGTGTVIELDCSKMCRGIGEEYCEYIRSN